MLGNPNDYENTTRTVPTRIGDFEYVGGFPTDEAVRRAYDHLDLQRASQVYLEFMPLLSQQAIFDSHDTARLVENRDIGVYDYQARGKVEDVGLTYNTESIYSTACVNVENGPVVVETPPNVLGVIDDGWMRYVTDLGNAGPDQGRGGSFLLAHEDNSDSELPDGYYTFRTPTYRNWVMIRAFVDDTGEGDTALDWYSRNHRVYPLATGPDPDAAYESFTQTYLNTTHPRDISYFERLAEVVQQEPSSIFSRYQLGLLKAIGIENGKPFVPDERMQALLSEGVEIGDAIAKANAYSCRLDGVRRYPDRRYEHLFLGGRHDFMSGDALWLDARTLFHYEAIVVTPAMAVEKPGVGSQYLTCYRDADENFLMGQHTYRLHLPPDVPAADFWSVTAYHPETRSLLANGQDKPAKNSYDDLFWNDDGSIDLHFGPTPPDGREQNWIKTLPDQGWQILLRLYGPLDSYFDGTWKPDDIVRTS